LKHWFWHFLSHPPICTLHAYNQPPADPPDGLYKGPFGFVALLWSAKPTNIQGRGGGGEAV
jgi:hypothetical protein